MILPVSMKAGLRPHPSNWTNEPEKAETHCLYCRMPVPNHSAECTIPRRTVVLEMKIKFVATVPANWDKEMIEFHRNDSSYCSSNDIRQIYEESEKDPDICATCQRTSVTFVREASEQDHEDLHYSKELDD